MSRLETSREAACPSGQIARIYDEFHEDVYRFLASFTGDRQEAEDLTQETFLRVIRSLRSYRGDSSLRTWIISIAKHIALDYHRHSKRLPRPASAARLELSATRDPGPHERAEAAERMSELHRALSNIDAVRRSVFVLRAVMELSVRETAKVMNCSEAKVKVDYHRVLKRLRRELKWDEEESI